MTLEADNENPDGPNGLAGKRVAEAHQQTLFSWILVETPVYSQRYINLKTNSEIESLDCPKV